MQALAVTKLYFIGTACFAEEVVSASVDAIALTCLKCLCLVTRATTVECTEGEK